MSKSYFNLQAGVGERAGEHAFQALSSRQNLVRVVEGPSPPGPGAGQRELGGCGPKSSVQSAHQGDHSCLACVPLSLAWRRDPACQLSVDALSVPKYLPGAGYHFLFIWTLSLFCEVALSHPDLPPPLEP